MKNKKVLLGIICFVILVFTILSVILFKSEENVVLNENTNNKNKINNSFLTYMIETESGSGIYEKTTANSWPESGYIFNSTLSGCENGGELKWDDENKQVLMLSVKSDKCYVYFDKYLSPTISSVSVTDTTTSSISVSVSASGGTNNVATYYYSINDGEYTSSSSNTHTFSGLNKGTTYSIKVYVKDTNGVDSVVYTINAETINEIFLADVCSNGTNLATCIKNYYNEAGSEMSGIYYHTSSLANSAGDNSYRYAGASDEVNNYVCFGSTLNECPYDNLYRIIGVFGTETKLIKADFASSSLLGTNGDYSEEENNPYRTYIGKLESWGKYFWSGNAWNDTDWRNSRLNTINLNTNFLSNIGSNWANKIVYHNWIIGGNVESNIIGSPPKNVYKNEIINPVANTTYNAKIGLIYVSDVGFASTNYYWGIINMEDFGFTDNWLMLRETEWTITRISDIKGSIASIWNSGDIWERNGCNITLNDAGTITSPSEEWAVRPVFYLNSNVVYISGSGTSSDPIRIN